MKLNCWAKNLPWPLVSSVKLIYYSNDTSLSCNHQRLNKQRKLLENAITNRPSLFLGRSCQVRILSPFVFSPRDTNLMNWTEPNRFKPGLFGFAKWTNRPDQSSCKPTDMTWAFMFFFHFYLLNRNYFVNSNEKGVNQL